MHLTINMRLLQHTNSTSQSEHYRHAQEFATWLLQMGDGIKNHDNMIDLPSRITISMI
jgi:hypothetical protein